MKAMDNWGGGGVGEGRGMDGRGRGRDGRGMVRGGRWDNWKLWIIEEGEG